MKKIIIVIAVLFVGYNTYNEGYKQGFSKAQNLNEKKIEESLAPQCFMGDCPEYESFDTDGDGKYESVVTERTFMTQQAGRVWVIDDGKVVFVSDDLAQIGVGSRSDSSGFIIYYATESPITGEKVFHDSFKSDYYIFEDGKYILEKTIDSPMD